MAQASSVELDLVFDVSNEADRDRVAQLIEQRLEALTIVKEVEAKATKQRMTGLEVAAAIGVSVIILRSSRMAVHEIRLLLQEVEALIQDIKELKSASVKIGKKRVPADEVDDKAIQDLLGEIKSMEDK
ncbi:MAG: hypothetical protein NVS2B12_11210 [Ktedonobacteraceae bacterium]